MSVILNSSPLKQMLWVLIRIVESPWPWSNMYPQHILLLRNETKTNKQKTNKKKQTKTNKQTNKKTQKNNKHLVSFNSPLKSPLLLFLLLSVTYEADVLLLIFPVILKNLTVKCDNQIKYIIRSMYQSVGDRILRVVSVENKKPVTH